MTVAIVGGYRLIRRIGEGSRAAVWLGHPIDDGSPVAVKLYGATSTAQEVATEIEALGRAAGPHVVAVRDIATTADGRWALVLERLGPHSLAALIAAGGALSPGEAVTVLAPLAQAVSRMHAAGVAHGGLRPTAVRFTDHGAPVLTSFGVASVAPRPHTPAELEADERVRDDSVAFLRLCIDVLEPIPGSDAVRQWLAERADSCSWPGEFDSRLFAWAAPEPISFDRAHARSVRAVEPVLRRPRAPVSPLATAVDRLTKALSADWAGWVKLQTSTVRPRFWAAGGAVAAALVLALAIVPGPSTGSSSDAAPVPLPSDSGRTSSSPHPMSAAEGDDPVAALRALLETRERCIRELSVLCLDAVGQPGSTALAHDQQLVRDLQEGAEIPPFVDAGEIVVEEILGGAALLSVTSADTEPASILIMRSEAGWRIREYLSEG